MRAHLTHLVLALAALGALPACDTAYANTSSTTSSATTQVPSDVIRSTFCTPTVTSVSANTGTELGGTAVTLTGTCFTGSTVAKFNSVNGTSFSVVGPTSITVTTPAYAPALSSTAADNAVAVAVTNPAGTGTLSAGYTYTSKFIPILGALYSSEYRANDPRITLNSGAVSSWPDYGGKGALAQASATLQPAFNATSWNGGPNITADGSNDALQATYGAGVLPSGNRPYFFVAYQALALPATKNAWQLGDGGGTNQIRLRPLVSGSQWSFARNGTVSSASQTEDLNKHLFEMGYTASGTNSIVIDATGSNSGNTGAAGANQTLFSMFCSESSGGNVNSSAVFILVASGTPSAQQLTDVRAAAKDSNWAGYTSGTLSLP